MRLCILALALSMSLALVACSSGGGDEDDPTPVPTLNATQIAERPTLLPRIRVGYPGGGLLVEVALTPEQIEKGLGFRDSLFEQGGMLFDLGSSRQPSFWMKGMRFPLDMIWIDEANTVVSVTANVQPEPGVADSQLQRYSPEQPVRYVLEVAAGKAVASNITAGTVLDFTIPDSIRALATPTVAAGTVALPSPTAVPGDGLPPSPVIGQ